MKYIEFLINHLLRGRFQVWVLKKCDASHFNWNFIFLNRENSPTRQKKKYDVIK